MVEFKKYILEQQEHSCSICEYFEKMVNDCNISEKVKMVYTEELMNKWLKNNTVSNQCRYFEKEK